MVYISYPYFCRYILRVTVGRNFPANVVAVSDFLVSVISYLCSCSTIMNKLIFLRVQCRCGTFHHLRKQAIISRQVFIVLHATLVFKRLIGEVISLIQQNDVLFNCVRGDNPGIESENWEPIHRILYCMLTVWNCVLNDFNSCGKTKRSCT
jgi:hypothetical protein